MLTGGSYSDYQVYAVFPTRGSAEEALANYQATESDGWGGPDMVEAIPFYGPGDKPRQVVTHDWQINVWDDGTTSSPHAHDSPGPWKDQRTEWDFHQLYPAGPRPSVRWVRAPIHNNKGGRLEVRGTDERAVAQAFSDNLARILLTVEQTGRADLHRAIS